MPRTLQKASFVLDNTQNHAQFCESLATCHFAQLHLFCVFSISVISCPICRQREGPEAKAELLDSNFIFKN